MKAGRKFRLAYEPTYSKGSRVSSNQAVNFCTVRVKTMLIKTTSTVYEHLLHITLVREKIR